MEVSFKITKKDLPRLIAAFICALVPTIFSATRVWDAIIWYWALFLLSFLTIKGKEKGKMQILLDVIIPIVTAFYSLYFMQYLNLVDHQKTLHFKSNSLYVLMYHSETTRWLYEITIVIGVYFLFRALFMSRRFAAIFTPLPFFLVGLIDFFVYNARGHEVLASDIYSIRTAMNVASEFTYPPFFPIIFLALPYALYILACLRIKEEKKLIPVWAKVAVYACLAAAFFGCFVVMLDKCSKTKRIKGWGDQGSTYNGLLLNVSLSVKSLFPEKPAGYKTTSIDDDFAQLGIDENATTVADDDSANIIVIMSESYMQLRDYLPMFGYFEDPTPFFNGLKENAIRGYALSSVYGGNTPNSEFEFLTSITTGYLPEGSIPYTMFIDKNIYSLPWYLNSLGYSTTAIHPYMASGWQRTKVYPYIGFEEMYFDTDMDYDDSDLYREWISDACAFENMMRIIEEKPEGQKTFTFLVTMQNHGGYSDSFDNLPVQEYVHNTFSGETGEVNMYIELMKKSDAALADLVNYLSNQDEKYVLLMFGDHQPSVNAFTNNMAPGRNSSWTVPYLLWSNFDMNEDLINAASAEGGPGLTSLNYLALDVMKAAGIEYSPYYQYINTIRQQIPCINATGYYSTEEGKFELVECINTDADREALSRYQTLQYNILFDNSNSQLENSLQETIQSALAQR